MWVAWYVLGWDYEGAPSGIEAVVILIFLTPFMCIAAILTVALYSAVVAAILVLVSIPFGGVFTLFKTIFESVKRLVK